MMGLADVLLYLIRLADKLNVDPITPSCTSNAAKDPVDKARGNAKEYTEL